MPAQRYQGIDVDRHVGQRIRALRGEKGLSQDALAKLIEVVPQQLSKYELGKNSMTAARLYAAALALSVKPDAFFAGLPGMNGGRS